jgi:hypothetical protein
MIDLQKPVLSAEREALWQFIPDRFFFTPVAEGSLPSDNETNDDLRAKVIAKLQAAGLASNSSGGKWLNVLRQKGQGLSQLRAAVSDYSAKIKNGLENPQTRAQQLKSLHSLVLDRRLAVLKHPILRSLNETGDRLFAVPETIIENPHHQR